MLLNIYTGEQARDTPYEIEILIPVDGYDPIGFTLTKLCGYISRGRRKKREKKREKKRKNLEIRVTRPRVYSVGEEDSCNFANHACPAVSAQGSQRTDERRYGSI
ncbi:hypothetical protein BHM03_00031120 [Ensete ventricosum]|nr:hypothetical protein BHM03_00031120 [Ensete ventricosum]